MRIDEFILLSLLGNEDTISGRTLLQKKLYFLNEKLKLGFRFIPYYYGPYNFEIAEAIENLKSSGIIFEKTDDLHNVNYTTIEPKKYTYTLTIIGKEVAKHIEKWHSEDAKNIKSELSLMKELGIDDSRSISVAAKMHHILKTEDKTMTVEDILEEANSLGWKISEDDAKKALEFLKNVRMIDDKEN